ncbi:hypothetical protein ABEB36_014991 [Hypothenemus hampei]|uniref:C2H2-type domain-containing protein n=1 Tax=Hypothenemus hampei TaxID=57062 RepID=A0ABD1E1H9_HYPHA
MDQIFNCNECGNNFHNMSNLRRHIRQFHQNKLQDLAPLHRKQSSNFLFTCAVCGKNFNKKNHLQFHMKTHNFTSNTVSKTNNKNNEDGKKKCPMFCGYTTSSSKSILDHLSTNHNIPINSQELVFSTMQEFEAWKSKIETDTNSKFIKFTESKNSVTFTCHRSGHYVAKGKGLRELKVKGSNKINAYCPANIKLCKEDGCYKVTHTDSHVGHRIELGHITLTSEERKNIAQKIANKIPFDIILDEIADSIVDSEKRIHILTRKDLHNIERSFNLSSVAIRHPNDALSVESWVIEMQRDQNCVLFYKAQGQLCNEQPFLKNDDFVLLIMTITQCEFLCKYGTDLICMDGTHGLNAYDFEMQTVLVLDDLREGFPCAFMISNRSDTEIMKLFISKIKERCGVIATKVFMSDLADASYNAWIAEMGTPERRLFCTWHTDRSWRKNLTKIKTKEKQVEIYRTLRTLLEERDADAFEIMITSFCEISDDEVKDFILYFKNNYLDSRKCWAYCYRLYSGVNTNMHLERMHGVIKYIFLKGKRVKRLDKAIAAIMQFVRSKLINRLIVIHKGKISSKIKDIRLRHKTMKSLDPKLIIANEDGWNVLSSTSKEIYVIQEMLQNCDYNRNENMNDLDDDNNLHMHCPSSETTIAMETHTILSEIGRKTIAKSLEQQK